MTFRAHLTALVGVMAFLSVGISEAAISYYTFEGTVTSTANDNAGAIALAGVQDNQSLTYIFAADPQTDGSSTQNNGVVVTKTGSVNDYFFADLLAGSLINEVNGGSHNSTVNIAEYNYGYNNNYFNSGGLQGGSADNFVTITSGSFDFTDWVLGTTLAGIESAYDSTGNLSEVLSSLTLTNISNVSPVPVPPALLLMGSGLIGLLVTRLTKSKRA